MPTEDMVKTAATALLLAIAGGACINWAVNRYMLSRRFTSAYGNKPRLFAPSMLTIAGIACTLLAIAAIWPLPPTWFGVILAGSIGAWVVSFLFIQKIAPLSSQQP